MRIDGMLEDEAVMMGMMTAIMEFAAELGAARRGAARRTARRPRLDLGERRARRLPDGAVGDGAGDRTVHLGRRRDDAHGHRARARRARPAIPTQWEAMAADPTLIPAAVEEIIRWVTPLNNIFRTATARREDRRHRRCTRATG